MFSALWNKPVKEPSVYEFLMNKFVYSRVEYFVQTFLYTYALVFLVGVMTGAFPFVLYYIVKKCGFKCCCISWFVIVPLAIINAAVAITYFYK